MKMPWIRSAPVDLSFILGPAFAVTLAVVAFPSVFRANGDLPLWAWVVFILLVDVAHVYGTLFRTYLDREDRRDFGSLLWIVPLACWLGGVLLYSFGALVFWRALAYVAVFHFVRQQYGFMRLYARHENLRPWERRIDAAAIYLAAGYPLLYWHLHLPRAFNWFVDGDFWSFGERLGPSVRAQVLTGAATIYAAVTAIYFYQQWRSGRPFNGPKNLLWFGTALSWWVGIVLYNGDLAFTAINVVAHGLPYMALTWSYRQTRRPRPWALTATVFFTVIFALAYAEELLWDRLVWADHPTLFAWAGTWPAFSATALVWLVPLLALPQSAHYVLDGFIWKLRSGQRSFAQGLDHIGDVNRLS